MRGYLLDTHIWFWYLTGADPLPNSIRELIDNSSDKCRFSPISVWELSMLAEKGRIDIVGEFRNWITKALRVFPIKEAPLNLEVSLVSGEIELPHRDPADHFISATTLVYDLTLLTLDEKLIGHEWLSSRSN